MPDEMRTATLKTDGAHRGVRSNSTALAVRPNAFFLFSFSTAATAEGAGV